MLSKRAVLCTYPRSGRSFFESLFYNKTGVFLDKTHLREEDDHINLNSYRNIITIIRNPLDSISSLATMKTSFSEEKQGWYKNDLSLFTENVLVKNIEEYETFYSNLLSLKSVPSVVIDFNELIINPVYVVETAAKYVDIPLSNKFYAHTVEDCTSQRFLKTSKEQFFYSTVLELVKRQNLDKCNELFNLYKQHVNI